MSSTPQPTKTRVLQIHVTRKCNLKCLHCYSSSGPEETETLPVAQLLDAVRDAKALGYTLVSLSGGEPFLYPDMEELLGFAHGLGMRTAVVTNGMFLDKRRLDGLKGVLDLIVVSLDGAPERHNRMRANPAAFEVMSRKVPALRDSGITFGFLFTLSRDNAHELDFAADFAADAGAAMLQVHPLDTESGRAAEGGTFDGLDPDIPTALIAGRRAYDAQKRLDGRLRIIVDFQPRLPDDMRPDVVDCGRKKSFADQVYPLCIETDGAIVPMGHGFSREFMMGQLGEQSLASMAKAWSHSGRAARYEALITRIATEANAPEAPELQNLAQTLRRESHGVGARIAAE